MVFEPRTAIFALKRYSHGKWVPVRLYLPVLAWLLGCVAFAQWGPTVSSRATVVLGILLDIGFFVFVLIAFWRVRRWRTKGRKELQLEGGRLRIVDPASQSVVGECQISAERVLPAEFDYGTDDGSVRGAPAFILNLDGDARITVGVSDGWFVWREGATHLARPEYSMSMRDWEKFIELMGISQYMVRRPSLTGLPR